jgi:hypothetical protein
MNKLILAAATAATVFGAGSTAFAPEAEAGMRIGFGFRPHFFRPHYYSAPPMAYRSHDDDEVRSRRRSIARSKPQPEKKAVPLVKFADGSGRQFDPASKVWFDGKSQCFSGKEQFTFKSNAWFYGKAKWAESNGIWQTNSPDAPELVSCQSVPSFAAKASAFATQTASQSENSKGAAEQPKTPPATVPKIKTAEGTTSEPAKAAPAVTECKKYFPSIGQLVVVPCGE